MGSDNRDQKQVDLCFRFVFQNVRNGTTDPAAVEEFVLMDWEEMEPAAVR